MDITLDDVIQQETERAQGIVKFAQQRLAAARGTALRPRMHQIVRIHEAVNNGTKRILCADTTSAGKTYTALLIQAALTEKKRRETGRADARARALLIAPNQGIHSAWTQEEINDYAAGTGFEPPNVVVLDRVLAGDSRAIRDAGLFCVNYDKLSIAPSENRYLSPIVENLDAFDVVFVDECHNLKNQNSNRSTAFLEIIARTLDKHFVMLSATPIPNRLSDAGFLLYMLDPVKYKRFAAGPFVYEENRFTITNAMHSGKWFTFTREDLRQTFSLPELRLGVPELGIGPVHNFELEEPDAQAYLDVWKRPDSAGPKIVDLSRILLRASFNPTKDLIKRIRTAQPNAQFGIFSFYKEGVSGELAAFLGDTLRAEEISGDLSLEERLRLARSFRKHEIDAAVCTLSTVSEAIPLSTGNTPTYVLFIEPPIVPANYEQAIGRFYRILQKNGVYVIEIIPTIKRKAEEMQAEKERLEEEGVKFRRTWKPTTVFEDKRQAREEKEEAIEGVSRGAQLSALVEASAEMLEGCENPAAYRSILRPVPPSSNPNISFNEGLKKARVCIGRGTLFESSEPKHALIGSYVSEDWEKTSSADTNEAIAQAIRAIRKATGNSLENILDWGSGPACLARKLKEKVTNFDMFSEMLEAGRRETQKIYREQADKYFKQGNARQMPFQAGQFQLVCSSYALQYNAQGYQHRKDIAEILAETNRVLAAGGYGIFALPNQATDQQDLKVLTEKLLPSFGFRTLACEFVSGHAQNEQTKRLNQVFQGFYFVLYQKERNVTLSETKSQDTDSDILFKPYKTLGIGGEREIEIQKRETGAYKKEDASATDFRVKREGRREDFIAYLERTLKGGAT
jgi:ubiquinone/menaquinone biosynthesis C-methylase UbiE